jgi:hypothetical protein
MDAPNEPVALDATLQQWRMYAVPMRPLYWFERLKAQDFGIRNLPRSVALDMVRQHHYSGGASNTGVRIHGLYLKVESSVPLGVAWWLPPMPGSARLVSQTRWKEVLCLHRFVLAPGVPKHAATFLLGQSLRVLRREGFAGVVTYADTGVVNPETGKPHEGIMYVAGNAEYLGLTSTRHARWMDPETNRMVCVKAGPRTRTAAEMEALGYVRHEATPKHRFRWRFRPHKDDVTPPAQIHPLILQNRALRALEKAA